MIARHGVVAWCVAACTALVLTGATSRPTRLAGIAIGAAVSEVVNLYGTPGFVATTDDGLEWRWFDARGLDIDLLADDTLAVRQILVGRPEPVRGVLSKLVQPQEFPVLEAPAAEASTVMKASGGVRLPEPENTILAWNVANDVVVLELRDNAVSKITAMDAAWAARTGYTSGTAARYRAPRLVRQFAVDYPKRALQEHAEGVVVVEVDLLPTAAVRKVSVLVSSGNADIDAAEMLSMRRSSFEAARCDDVPCAGVYLDREEYSLAP